MNTIVSYNNRNILSIRLSADGFSFSILDPAGHQPFMYSSVQVTPGISLTANIKQTLAHEELLLQKGRRTLVLLENPRWTVVPLDLFEEKHAEAIFAQSQQVVSGEKVLYNILEKSNVVILFSMEQAAWQLVNELWPNAHIYASISPIINHLTIKSHSSTDCCKMYVHMSKRAADIIVLQNGMPVLMNSYVCQNTDDVLYYTLNVWKQMGLDQQSDEIYLLGNHSEKEALVTKLGVFIETVVDVNPKVEFNRSEVVECKDEVPYDMLTLLHSNL